MATCNELTPNDRICAQFFIDDNFNGSKHFYRKFNHAMKAFNLHMLVGNYCTPLTDIYGKMWACAKPDNEGTYYPEIWTDWYGATSRRNWLLKEAEMRGRYAKKKREQEQEAEKQKIEPSTLGTFISNSTTANWTPKIHFSN
jgi:hypothetical protein